MVQTTVNMDQIENLSIQELDVLERKISTKYMQVVPWGAVVWGIGNTLVWLALFPLVMLEIVPLWAGFLVATLNAILAYLPSHEAQHNIIANRGRPLRWLNELVGHMSLLPLNQPYRVMRATHMEHHAHTNHPEFDCDYGVHAPTAWQFLWNSILGKQPGSKRGGDYYRCLERTGQTHIFTDAIIYNLAYVAILATLAWTGFAIEAFLLWVIPKFIGVTYLEFYLSWMPHHPGEAQGRYQDTRAFKSKLGNIVSMGMQYHIIHHLYPRIPLSLTPAAYRELKPILERRECDLGAL